MQTPFFTRLGMALDGVLGNRKMPVRKLFEIPYPSTSAVESHCFYEGPNGVQLTIDCHDVDAPLVRSTITVHSCRAIRTLAELYCKRWHLQAYDAVCEIEDSPWAGELAKATPSGWENWWVLKHFMLYLDSMGCYEFIAESVTIENTVLDATPNTVLDEPE